MTKHDRGRWAIMMVAGLLAVGAGVAVVRSAPPRPGPASRPGTDTRTGITWVTIPAGSFLMGSTTGNDDEKPVRRVTLPAFQLSRSEVTVAQYRRCVQAKACTTPDSRSRDPGADDRYCNWGTGGREDHPVNCVSRDQAVAYARWAGGRLPTESEWEYAARAGGKPQAYPWGDAAPSCARTVMSEKVAGCGRQGTWPVCSKPQGSTAQGLCDLSGNVAEWVQDFYHDSYTGAPLTGVAFGSTTGEARVLRGGAWSSSLASSLRSAAREKVALEFRFNSTGIRVARTP